MKTTLTTLVLLFAATEAAAQAAPDTVRLPELRVEVGRLEMGGVPLLRVPFGVQSLVGARAQRGLTLSDALDGRVPGLSTADVMGAAAQQDMSVRGFSVSPVIGLPQGIGVFVDGVRVNEPDMSQVYFSLIPMHAAARVDVLRGASGVLGKNALGGAINVVTASAAERGIEASLRADDFGGIEGHGLLASGSGAWSGLGSVAIARSSGWRDASSHALLQTFTRAEWRGAAIRAWAWHSYAQDSVLQAGSLPRSWLRSHDSIPERWRGNADARTINFTGGDLFRPQMHMLVGGVQAPLGDALLSARVYHRRLDVDQFNANFTEPDTRIGSQTRLSGMTAQLSRTRGRLQLAAGGEYSRADVDIRIYELPNETHPEIPMAGEQSEHVGTREHDAALFTTARIELSRRTAVSASLRYDHVVLPFRDRLEPENDGDNTFRQLTGSMAFDHEIGRGVAAFTSVARGFRAPTIMELACADPEDPCPLPYELGADPPLEPVVADTWQAGVRALQGRWQGELVGYWTEVHDEIFNVLAPQSRAGYFTNLERTRRQGVELTARVAAQSWLVLDGTFALTRATFRTAATLSAPYIEGDEDEDEDAGAADDDDVAPPAVGRGSRLPMLPAVRASFGATASHLGWGLELRADHTGAQWLRGDEDNSEPDDRVPASTLLSLEVTRRVRDVVIEAGVENLLDRVHYRAGVLSLNQLNSEHRIEPFLTPGAPRRLYVGVRYATD